MNDEPREITDKEKIRHLEEKVKELKNSSKKWKEDRDVFFLRNGDLIRLNDTLREERDQAEFHLKEITDKWESLKFKMFDLEEKVKDAGTNYLEALRLATIYKEGWEQAEARLKRLQEAVDKNETYKRTHNKVVSLEDEELYQTLNGMKCE